MVKIAKNAGFQVVQIGESDYPLNSFRVRYSSGKSEVSLYPKHRSMLGVPRLKFKFDDIADSSGDPVGSTETLVRAYLQEHLYVETPAVDSGDPLEE